MSASSWPHSSFITVSDLAQYSRSLGVPVLLISPPKVANQNTPRQKWEAARKMWMAYEECHWFKNQELEPNMPHEAKSVLAQWLNQVDVTVWQCVVPLDTEEAWCHHPHLKRFDRALAHVRSHLGLKPFRCDGKCGMNTWYAIDLYNHLVC